jgi:hypothetical protein
MDESSGPDGGTGSTLTVWVFPAISKISCNYIDSGQMPVMAQSDICFKESRKSKNIQWKKGDIIRPCSGWFDSVLDGFDPVLDVLDAAQDGSELMIM